MIEAAARNMAAWHHWQLTAHGLRCSYSDSLWRCRERDPGIFLGAITLSPTSPKNQKRLLTEIESLASARKEDSFVLCDSWMTLDISHLGFEPLRTVPVYRRPPGPAPSVNIPTELHIETVTDPAELDAFEEASIRGFQSPHQQSIRWHVAASLGRANTSYFTGWVDGQIASVSIGVVSDGVVGIYGVATLPEYRGRGYATALTWSALQMAPDLPAVLEPSDMAASMYRRMGFAEVCQFRYWMHKPG